MRLSLGASGFEPLATAREAARLAEEGGLDGIWSAEHIGFHDAVVPSALHLAATERLQVGIVGPSAVSRHPGLFAMELASLSELGPGRVRVQVGTGDPGLTATLGGSMEGSLARVESFATTLRGALAGEKLSGDLPAGRFERYRLARFAPPVPVDVMAIRPRMLRVAARVGDGVSLSAGASRTYLRETVETLEKELAAAGRARADFRITAFAFGFIADDLDGLLTAAGAQLAGYPAETTAVLARGVIDGEALLAAVRAEGAAGAAPFFTPQALRRITLAGEPGALAGPLQEYADTGIDELAVIPMVQPDVWLDAVAALGDAHRARRAV